MILGQELNGTQFGSSNGELTQTTAMNITELDEKVIKQHKL